MKTTRTFLVGLEKLWNQFIIDNKKDISIVLRCETPKCKSIICNDCEIKLQEQLENSNQIINIGGLRFKC